MAISSKAKTMGRLELLSWLNELTESDYPKLEACSDAIGYCQIIDQLKPGVIHLQKLNCNHLFWVQCLNFKVNPR